MSCQFSYYVEFYWTIDDLVQVVELQVNFMILTYKLTSE